MRTILLSIVCFCLLISCQKEYSKEEPKTLAVAVFSFSDTPSTCPAATVSGTYSPGTALSASNTVSIPVTVTKAGTYTITTNEVNGYSFSASGSFAVSGVQTILLHGNGKPMNSGTDMFTPNDGNSAGCSFSVTVVAAEPATYTLAGAPNTCSNATVNGQYGINVPLTSNNTVTLPVNVTKAGSFTLTTNTVGGMTFSSSGTFTSTGLQTVVLAGSGTPTSAGDNVLTPQVGNSSCTFKVVVTGPASYTLNGAPGSCTGFVVNGTYRMNEALTASNTVSVQVNVASVGAYTLSTTTVAGLTFSGTGSFLNTGVQTVVLKGNGTPTASGPQVFTLQAGISSCTFTVPVEGPAQFTLVGAPGTCSNAIVNGTYTVNTPLSGSNTISVQVDVTSPGAYTISTNTVGGMSFSKSGTFTSIGQQSVVLNGTGTPAVSGVNTLTITNSGCAVEVNVVAAPVVAGVFQCKMDGVLTVFTDRAQAKTLDRFYNPPTPYLYLDGYTAPPDGTEIPQLQLFITKNDNSTVVPGTYNVDNYTSVNGYRIEVDYHKVYPDQSVIIWNTSSSLFSPNPAFSIVVTSVSSTRVKGTFSGKITNVFQGSTTIMNVTEGVFDLPIVN